MQSLPGFKQVLSFLSPYRSLYGLHLISLTAFFVNVIPKDLNFKSPGLEILSPLVYQAGFELLVNGDLDLWMDLSAMMAALAFKFYVE